MLLALDPGMNSPGVALFVPNTPGMMLRYAARLASPAFYTELPDGARWLRVAHDIASWANTRGRVQQVVFEKPQWYQRSKSKGDPNDLVGVSGVAACVIGILSVCEALEVKSPTPAEWIGQVPKVCPICRGRKTLPTVNAKTLRPKRVKAECPECHGSAWGTPRGHRIRSHLTEAEIVLVPDQNDAIDAVGIGLWALGRLAPRSVFSNGRDGR